MSNNLLFMFLFITTIELCMGWHHEHIQHWCGALQILLLNDPIIIGFFLSSMMNPENTVGTIINASVCFSGLHCCFMQLKWLQLYYKTYYPVNNSISTKNRFLIKVCGWLAFLYEHIFGSGGITWSHLGTTHSSCSGENTKEFALSNNKHWTCFKIHMLVIAPLFNPNKIIIPNPEQIMQNVCDVIFDIRLQQLCGSR